MFNLTWKFYALAGMRTGLLIYTIFHIFNLKKVKKYASYTKAMFFYGLILLTSNFIVNATEPGNFVAQSIIVMLLVFVFYLAIPNKFVYQTTLGLIAIVSEVIIIVFSGNKRIIYGPFSNVSEYAACIYCSSIKLLAVAETS